MREILLSPEMQQKIASGLDEHAVLQHTNEAFELLLSPGLRNYDGQDTQRMKELLATGLVDVNALADVPLEHKNRADEKLSTGLLHLAVMKMKPAILVLLCQHDANANLHNSDGNIALYNLCHNDLVRALPFANYARQMAIDVQLEMADTLISFGANPDLIRTNGRSAAADAVEYTAMPLLEFYMKRGANLLTHPSPFDNPHALLAERRLAISRVGKLSEREHEAFDNVSRALPRLKKDCTRQLEKQYSPPISQSSQVFAFANAGMLDTLFDVPRWHGHEALARDIIMELPPFLQQKMELYLSHFSLVAFEQELIQLPAPSDGWASKIISNPSSGKER